MSKKIIVDREEFINLWESGYTGPQLREHFRKKLGRKTFGRTALDRIKKEFGISGQPIHKIDKNFEEAEYMWKSPLYFKKDIQEKFSICKDTLDKKALNNNWGNFIPYNIVIFDGTVKTLKEILIYNKDSGIFYWKQDRKGGIIKGDIAGGLKEGYITITLNNIKYSAHRLAVLYMSGNWPKDCVDHINHIRNDNSWKNLREVSKKDNARNQSLPYNDKIGIRGLSFNEKKNRWIVQLIGVKKIYKSFIKKHDALYFLKSKRKEFGYHENHGKLNDTQYDNTKRQRLLKEQTPENMDKYLMKLILDNTPDGYHDDHIIPLSKGGLHEPSNIQYITAEENSKKGSKYPFDCKTAINPITYLIDGGLLDEKSYKVN